MNGEKTRNEEKVRNEERTQNEDKTLRDEELDEVAGGGNLRPPYENQDKAHPFF